MILIQGSVKIDAMLAGLGLGAKGISTVDLSGFSLTRRVTGAGNSSSEALHLSDSISPRALEGGMPTMPVIEPRVVTHLRMCFSKVLGMEKGVEQKRHR